MGSLNSFAKWAGVWTLAVAACFILVVTSSSQEAANAGADSSSDQFHEGFEQARTGWIEEGGDVAHRVRVHDRTSDSAHSGNRSERIGITAASGTHLYYSHPIGRALVADDLQISLWVKTDRPGVQVLARVVFPRERDPDTLQLLSTLIPGSAYDLPGTWQRLEVVQPDVAMERQARLLRASLRRDVDTREAYVDRVLLNVYCGPGDSDVLVDDLEVSPVLNETVRLSSATLGQPGGAANAAVEVSQDRLLVDGYPKLLRAIRAPGVSPAMLKEFGFNVLAVEWPLDIPALQEAATSGLWLLPRLPGPLGDSQQGNRPLAQVLGELPFRESVLCWYLGTSIGPDSLERLAETVRELRAGAPHRPAAADVTGNFRAYSREVEMIGAHRWPIGTAMEIGEYRDWLTQRRYLARPGTYFFTWVQAAPDPADAAQPQSGGLEPDQIRLLTYASLAAGCRGLGFWGDDTLGQPGAGRQRLLELGLLNLELQLLEPYFASAGSATTLTIDNTAATVKRGPGADPNETKSDFGRKRGFSGGFAPRSKPKTPAALPDRAEVQATLLRSDRGLVVIPVWYGKGAQFVAGQYATNDLSMVIPGIPDASQAWQVTPADIRMLKRERVAGGTRLTLPEFDLTGIVVLTSETSMVQQLRSDIAKTRPWAALWAAELATAELERVKQVNAQLALIGRSQPDASELIRSAEERLAACRGALGRSEYAASYSESQRARRALRILQRAHWDDAVKSLSVPQASPYATSFASLPDHWRLMRAASDGKFSDNLIEGGDFESAEALAAGGWTQRADEGAELELRATLSAHEPHRGERSLHLQVQSTREHDLPAALDPLMAALVSRPIAVKAGDLVRIRFWLRIPAAIRGSIEGVTIYDSLGGPALAVSRAEPLEWKQYTLYRRAARSDEMTITFALGGIGDMYIDDLEVERLETAASLTQEKFPLLRR